MQLSSHTRIKRAGTGLGVLWSVWISVGGPAVCCGQRALTRAYVAIDWRACERNRCSVCQPCGLNRGFVTEDSCMSHLRQRLHPSLISREWSFEEGRLACGGEDMGWEGADHQLLNAHACTHIHMNVIYLSLNYF